MSPVHKEIRKPAVAGSFYPGSPGDLTKAIASMFAAVDKVPIDGYPLALVVPHAGYPYSGRTAARAYKLLEGREFDTVVVISPSHTVFFQGSAVYGGDGYETPLGVVETDHELSNRISTINPSVYCSKMGHATGSVRGEHALEVQLPFLQVVLGKFKLVAIVMGDQEIDSVRALGEVLGSALKDTNSLIIASSDLSHFHNEETARRLDGEIRKAVEQYDSDLLMRKLEAGKGEACGGGPIAAAMIATRRLGGRKAQFIQYTTSGETTGDFSEVVGYLSAVFLGEKEPKAKSPTVGTPAAQPARKRELSEEDKQLLHRIAKEAIGARLMGDEYSPPSNQSLERKSGAFVTIKLHGVLRGCIGQIRANQPLYKTIAEMAVAAAFEDPRFQPITMDDFEYLDIVISVLSPLERVHDLRNIGVGCHGLMVKLDFHSGLLLPQVATENEWGLTEFLEQTCLKAGVPRTSYKDKNAEIYKFTADVF